MPSCPSIRTASFLILVLAAAGCGSPEADLASSGKALGRAFHDSARRFEVPEAVLLGIGWEQTRWFHPEEQSLIGGSGMMGILEGEPMEEAARLTGTSIETLKSDPAANIDGGAALLRQLADRYFDAYPSRDPKRLSDWFEVVKLASGVDDPEMAEVFGVGVFRAIDQGASRPFPDGTTLRLVPADPGEVDLGSDLIYARATQYLQPDYPSAIWRPSPNYSSRGGATVSKIVIHTCQGGYSGCVSWLRNTAAQASAHYVISKGGEISQLVENRNKAWHARCHNPETIGIEHEGFVSDAQNYTDAMLRASAALVRFLADTHGVPRDTAHIVGHGDPSLADCNTHTDPGPYWNWSAFMGLVNGTGGGGPAPSTGTVKGYVFWGDRASDYGTNVTDASKRLGDASVTFSPGGEKARTNASGFFQIDLAPGTYTVQAEASGYTEAERPDPVNVTAGAVSWGSTMVISPAPPPPADTTAPAVVITSPATGSVIDLAELEVTGTVSDASAIASLTVAGQPTSLTGGAFDATIVLIPGEQSIEVIATDSAGNVGRASVTVRYDLPRSGVFGSVFDGTAGETTRIAGARLVFGEVAETLSDAAGGFEITLPAGTYQLTTTAPGYDARVDRVVVKEGLMLRLDLPLAPASGATKDPEIQATQATGSGGCGCTATGDGPPGQGALGLLALGLLGVGACRRRRRPSPAS